MSDHAEVVVTADSATPNRRRWVLWSALGFVVLSTLTVAVFATIQPRPATMIVATNLDFGEQWASPKFEWTVSLTNPGDRDVKVLRLNSSCRCNSISPESMVVPAHSTSPVTLQIDLTQRTFLDLTAPDEKVAVSVTAELEGSESVSSWQVTGTARNSYVSSAADIRFPDALVRGRRYPQATVVLTPAISASIISASCDPQLATVSIQRFPGSPATLQLGVTPSDALPLGVFSIPIQITVEESPGKYLPTRSIQTRGEIVADIYLLPSTIDFSVVAAGDSSSQTCSLQSHLGTSFRIVSTTVDDPAVKLTCKEDEFASRHDIQCEGILASAGPYASTASVEVETTAGEKLQLTISLRAYVLSR